MSAERGRAPPGSWRLLGPAALGWAATAAVIAVPGTARWLAAGVACAGVSVGLFALRSRRARALLRSVAIACAVLLLLSVRVDSGEWARGASELHDAANSHVSAVCHGTLASYPSARASPTGGTLWVRANCGVGGGAVPVLLWLEEPPSSEWAPGMRLRAEGRIAGLGATSSAAYGITVTAIDVAAPATWRERLGAISAELRIGLRDRAAVEPGAELVPGFAVGDTSLVGDGLEQAMLTSSLTHLTAVSGSNCALVTAAVLAAASRLGAGRRLKVVLAATGLAGFVVLVGPDASVQRAAVMAAVVLVSSFGGKRAVSLPALGMAMLVLLLADPWQALEAGFALSVAATAGILLLVPALRAGLTRVPYLPQWVALPVALAIASQIACGPLLLLLRPGIPAAGVLANVLAAPAAPMGTGLGLLALLLLPLGPVSEVLGDVVLWLASLAARWVAATAEVTSALPLATLAWPEGWLGSLLLAAVEAAAILTWALATGRVSLFGLRKEPKPLWGAEPTRSWGFRGVTALLAGSSAGVFIAVVGAAPLAERMNTPRDWVVVACDVGQGDAILVRDPAAPRDVMLIDTGDDEMLLNACLDRFGVSRVALLVLTHDDRDHVGALGAVSGRTDAALIAPDSAPEAAQHQEERPLRRSLDAAEVPFMIGEAGLNGGTPGLLWSVLAPVEGVTPGSTNAASVVLRIEAGGVSILALGDTGENEHRSLRARESDLSVDLVKVAHHGSGDQDPELLRKAGARLGLISVGADNSYGHPAPTALEALEAAGTRALRTDEHGSIAVSLRDGELAIWAAAGVRE